MYRKLALLKERFVRAGLELFFSSLSDAILSRDQEIVRLRERLDTQVERNRLLSGLLDADEAKRRAASDEINNRILKDMREHPEKYIGSPD